MHFHFILFHFQRINRWKYWEFHWLILYNMHRRIHMRTYAFTHSHKHRFNVIRFNILMHWKGVIKYKYKHRRSSHGLELNIFSCAKCHWNWNEIKNTIVFDDWNQMSFDIFNFECAFDRNYYLFIYLLLLNDTSHAALNRFDFYLITEMLMCHNL